MSLATKTETLDQRTTIGHLARGREVWTYLPDGQPRGVLTGYADQHGGVVLEHMIVLPGGRLRPMLQAALEDAWAAGWAYVVLALFEGSRPELRTLACRMGFEEYAQTPQAAWFVKYRPC